MEKSQLARDRPEDAWLRKCGWRSYCTGINWNLSRSLNFWGRVWLYANNELIYFLFYFTSYVTNEWVDASCHPAVWFSEFVNSSPIRKRTKNEQRIGYGNAKYGTTAEEARLAASFCHCAINSVPTGANQCQLSPTIANHCQPVPTSANPSSWRRPK